MKGDKIIKVDCSAEPVTVSLFKLGWKSTLSTDENLDVKDCFTVFTATVQDV